MMRNREKLSVLISAAFTLVLFSAGCGMKAPVKQSAAPPDSTTKQEITYGYSSPKQPSCTDLIKQMRGKSPEEIVKMGQENTPTQDRFCGRWSYELGVAHYQLGDKEKAREKFGEAMQDNEYHDKANAWFQSIGVR